MAATEVSKPRDISMDDNISDTEDGKESPENVKPKIFDNMNYVEAPLPTKNPWGKVTPQTQHVCNNVHAEEPDVPAPMEDTPTGENSSVYTSSAIRQLLHFSLCSHMLYTYKLLYTYQL